MCTLTLGRGPAAPGWHISINVDNKAVEEWGHFIKSRVHPIVINHGNFMFAITVKSLYYSCTAIRSPCLDTIYRQFQVAWMFIVQWALWSLTSGVLSQVVSMSPISRWWGRRMFWCGTQRARIRLHTSPRQRRECHPTSHWFWIMHPAHHGSLGVKQRVLIVKSIGNSDSGLIGIRNWRWSSSFLGVKWDL